jgi:hypothetical protein
MDRVLMAVAKSCRDNRPGDEPDMVISGLDQIWKSRALIGPWLRLCSRFAVMMLCPILCPSVPKIVPLPYTAADRLMALGRIHESA